MKSKEYYRAQYELQKQQFETSKQLKVKNLENDIEATSKKISNLQAHLDQLQLNKKKVSEENFVSFEDFFRKITEQSENSKKRNQTS